MCLFWDFPRRTEMTTVINNGQPPSGGGAVIVTPSSPVLATRLTTVLVYGHVQQLLDGDEDNGRHRHSITSPADAAGKHNSKEDDVVHVDDDDMDDNNCNHQQEQVGSKSLAALYLTWLLFLNWPFGGESQLRARPTYLSSHTSHFLTRSSFPLLFPSKMNSR